MNTIKKIICFVIILVATCSICIMTACNSNQTDDSVSSSTSSSTSSSVSSSSITTKTINITANNYKTYLNFSNTITSQNSYVSGYFEISSGYYSTAPALTYITYVRTIQINITPLCEGVYSGKIIIKESKWNCGSLSITLNRDGTGTGSISATIEVLGTTTTPNTQYYSVISSTATVTITT